MLLSSFHRTKAGDTLVLCTDFSNLHSFIEGFSIEFGILIRETHIILIITKSVMGKLF